MIVQLDADGRLGLAASDDFARLHCEFAQSASQLPAVRELLEGAVELASADEAWIELSWLRRQAPQSSEAWTRNFDRMIAGAKPFGWVSSDGLRVKAHVIWADTNQQRP